VERRIYVDVNYRIPGEDERYKSATGVFGPYSNPYLAEQAVTNLAARPDVISAIIRDPDLGED